MPKRSNDFQKLIKLIQEQLADEDVNIEESKLLKDFRDGQKREVDIYIETKISGYPVKIAVECRDHKREMGKEWIDSLIGKFEYLPIDKVIAVSKSGFYNSAINVARQSKIELLTLEDALEEDWVRDVKNLDAMFITLVRFRPINISFDADGGLFEKDVSKIKVFNKEELIGNLKDYSSSILQHPNIKNPIRSTLIQNYDDEIEDFKNGNVAEAKWNLNKTIILKDDYKFQSKLISIRYKFKCDVNKASIPTEKFSYNDANVATVTKEMHDMKIIMSVSESEEKEPTLAVSMEIKNKNGKNFTEDIITTPLPTYEGPIEFTRYVLG